MVDGRAQSLITIWKLQCRPYEVFILGVAHHHCISAQRGSNVFPGQCRASGQSEGLQLSHGSGLRGGGGGIAQVGPVNVRQHLLAPNAAFNHLFERYAVLCRQSAQTIAPKTHGLHRHATFACDLRGAASALDSLRDCIHAINSTVVEDLIQQLYLPQFNKCLMIESYGTR